MTVREAVWLSVRERAATSGACALCGIAPARVEAVAVVRHAHGGTAEFLACDRCTRALKRLVAAIGGDGALVGATTTPVTSSAPERASTPMPMPAVVARVRARSRPRVLQAEVLLEYAEQLVTPDGTRYSVRACGGPRADGGWVGWLEFVAVGETAVRRTSQETTQPSREALTYWASGLEPVYLQGAFARAR